MDGDFLSSDDVELVQTIAGYVAVALDNAQLYTSLEQKALEIARLKDFSENIVESLNVGVLAVDLGGMVESWNTRMEQLFGVTRQEAVGQQLRALLPEELAAEIAARGDEEQITGIYKQRLQHQGKSLTLNVSITPLVSKSGERIGRLLLFDDVTQRERMEEQMSQTEKLTSLGLLAAGVAHEVNTPLAVISNYIQMLAKQMPEGDPRQAHHRKDREADFPRQRNRQQSVEFLAHRRRGNCRHRCQSRGRRNPVAGRASAEDLADSGREAIGRDAAARARLRQQAAAGVS